jgi:hypothetical protein
MQIKVFLLAGASLLALAAGSSAANASPIDFTYRGSIVDWTVPTTGIYDILAYGA